MNAGRFANEHFRTASDVGHANSQPQSQTNRTALGAEQQPLSPSDDKPKQRCDRCGKPFSPRHGSGGTKQRFCSRDCQRTSNRERQRRQRSGSYAGRTTLPASGQPTQNDTPTRDLAVAALHRWETGVLDIANCDRTEFVVP